MKKIKKYRGSALVFAVIVLVAALMVVMAISLISTMERKMASKTNATIPAFQNADNGMEWVFGQMKVANGADSVAAVFGVVGTTGEIACPGGHCEVYFVDKHGDVVTSVNAATTRLKDVRVVRSVGKAIRGDDQAVRTAEALVNDRCKFYITEDEMTPDLIGSDGAGGDAECDSGYHMCAVGENVGCVLDVNKSCLTKGWTFSKLTTDASAYKENCKNWSVQNSGNTGPVVTISYGSATPGKVDCDEAETAHIGVACCSD